MNRMSRWLICGDGRQKWRWMWMLKGEKRPRGVQADDVLSVSLCAHRWRQIGCVCVKSKDWWLAGTFFYFFFLPAPLCSVSLLLWEDTAPCLTVPVKTEKTAVRYCLWLGHSQRSLWKHDSGSKFWTVNVTNLDTVRGLLFSVLKVCVFCSNRTLWIISSLCLCRMFWKQTGGSGSVQEWAAGKKQKINNIWEILFMQYLCLTRAGATFAALTCYNVASLQQMFCTLYFYSQFLWMILGKKDSGQNVHYLSLHSKK